LAPRRGSSLTVVVALVGLGVLIVPVFWAAGHPNTRRQRTRQRPENIPGAGPTGDPRSVTPHRGDNREGDVAGPAGDGAGGQGHWPSERLEDRYVPEGAAHMCVP
jgi:hypothetical protein